MTLLPARQTFFRFRPSGLSPCPRRRYLRRLCVCLYLAGRNARVTLCICFPAWRSRFDYSLVPQRAQSVCLGNARGGTAALFARNQPVCVCVRNPPPPQPFARRPLLAMLRNWFCVTVFAKSSADEETPTSRSVCTWVAVTRRL